MLLLESADRKTTGKRPCTGFLFISSFMKERIKMSRQYRLIQLPLVGAILLCLLVGVYLLAWKRFSKKKRSSAIIKHKVDKHADDALKYWTADKMRNAKATNMPKVDALDQEKQHPGGSSSSPHQA